MLLLVTFRASHINVDAAATLSLAGRRATVVGSMARLMHPTVTEALERCVETVAAGAGWAEEAIAKALVGAEFEVLVRDTLSWRLFSPSSLAQQQSSIHFQVASCAPLKSRPSEELVAAERRMKRQLCRATDAKADGVSAFTVKDFRAAMAAFRCALKALETGLLPLVHFPEADVAAVCGASITAAREMAAVCLANLAQCVLLLPTADVASSELHQAVRHCDKGLRLLESASMPSTSSPIRVKLLFRKAKLLRQLCDNTAAVGVLRQLESMNLDAQAQDDVRRELRAVRSGFGA